MSELKQNLINIAEEVRTKIIPENIRAGVNMFGVEGGYAGLDTTDATATAEDILLGKTAYVDGEKITGIMELAQTPRVPAIEPVWDGSGNFYNPNIVWDNIAKDNPNILCYAFRKMYDTADTIINIPDTDKVTLQLTKHFSTTDYYTFKTISNNQDYSNSVDISYTAYPSIVYEGTGSEALPYAYTLPGSSSYSAIQFTNNAKITGGTTKDVALISDTVGYATNARIAIHGYPSALDGKTIKVLKSTLSTGVDISYTTWYGYMSSTSSNTFTTQNILNKNNGVYYGSVYTTSNLVIPKDNFITYPRILFITVKCGDGSRSFTDEELNELKTCFEIV